MGFVINNEKSALVPSTTINYLGHILDSVKFKVFLPDDKINKIISYCDTLLNKKVCVIREIAKLIGLFTSSLHAINLGALSFRYLDKDKVQALAMENGNYDAKIILSEFSWWKNNKRIKNGKWIRDPKIDIYIETDASKAGWGANLDGTTTGGRWSVAESVFHINILEIMAIKFALQSLCQNLRNIHICIRSDNSAQFHTSIIKVDL